MKQASSRPGRAWVWFFVVLGALALTAIVIQIWYNWSHQLNADQLAEAEAVWKEKGPRNYDMEYTVRKIDGTEVYAVKVRNGKVMSVLRDSRPVEQRLYHYSDMMGLFDIIEKFIAHDTPNGSEPKHRVFTRAEFDRHDGHLLHYVRSVAFTHERVEIIVDFHPL
jgi:hypothetical protein